MVDVLQTCRVNCCPACGHRFKDERSVNGGKIGGRKRMAALSKAERSELGRKAVRARWAKVKGAK